MRSNPNHNPTYKWSIMLLAAFCFMFQSCLEDDCEATRTFIQSDPVYVDEADIRVDITATASKEIEKPGKIYSYGKYLFINERREGLHIIDNTTPASPQNIGFINIPGNLDMAIRDGVLYADSYIDLLAIDVSDPTNPDLLCRLESVYNQYQFWEDRGYLVYYEETEKSIEVDCQDPRFGQDEFFLDGVRFANVDFDASSAAGGNKDGSVGIGGSTARFTIAKNHLYAVDEASMYIFDLEEPTKPVQRTTERLGWGIETIWPYKDLLFIGGNTGMQIYNNESPGRPYFLSEFSHARACDPVVADDKYAYVTLRDGTFCESFTNQLDVIDIADLKSPELVESYPMDNPHGLSIVNEHLYICEGIHGLKVFNASDPDKIDDNLLDHVKDIVAYDVIALSVDHIIVIGDEGLYQYDASDKENLKQISLIPVPKK